MKLVRSLLAATALAGALVASHAFAATPEPKEVVAAYANLAQAMYEDALKGARELKTAVDAFLADPTEDKLKAARAAWVRARVPYQQTEGFRFGNPLMDEMEGKVNAWPLDEGLIDYVDTKSYGKESDENPLFTANVIANKKLRVGKKNVDARKIDKALLGETLHEADGVESNVATGYHAIEFLLWGQDLNGTGPGAGKRPASDFAKGKACTHKNCDRRADYLRAATDLLIDDLSEMAAAWAATGAARAEVAKKTPDEGLAVILTGLGSLSYGELAGERMKLGLILHDPEEEHDCFSDNTHNSHFYDQVGMQAIYNGRYERADGTVVSGASLADYARAKAPAAAERVENAMKSTRERLGAIKKRADDGVEAYDQMIGEGNAEGNRLVQDGVEGLIGQARAIEALVADLGLKIKIQGSESLDNPEAAK